MSNLKPAPFWLKPAVVDDIIALIEQPRLHLVREDEPVPADRPSAARGRYPFRGDDRG